MPRSIASRGLRSAGIFLLGSLLGAFPLAAELPRHPALSQGPPPSWVEILDGRPVPEAAAGSSALAYRLNDQQIQVQGSATSLYRSLVVEVLTEAGVEDAARWEVNFDPQYRRLRIHQLDVYRDGIWTDRLPSAQGSLSHREEELRRRLYDERQSLLLKLEDVRVGDLVRFSYTLEGRNPALGERYAASFDLGYSIPVAELRVRLRVPTGEPFFYRLQGTELEPETLRLGGWQELTWHRRDVAAMPLDPDAPPDFEPWPLVQVSQFESWEQVSAWGRELYAPQPLPQELQEVRDAIALEYAGPSDSPHLDAEAAQGRFLAASRWVQGEVRYVGIPLGPHSPAPHDVADITRRRDGDSQDKTRVLITLLESLGIEAWPAWVKFNGTDLQRVHPSPRLFDHVVTAARLPQGIVWIDPTEPLQGGDLTSFYFRSFHTALELRPDIDAPTLLPDQRSGPGGLDVHHAYHLDSENNILTAVVRTTFKGYQADVHRGFLDTYSLEEVEQVYIDFYTAGKSTVEPMAPIEVHDDLEANELTIIERYRLIDCWQPNEVKEHTCDLLPLNLSSILTQPKKLDRTAPLDLDQGYEVHEVIDLRTTGDWDFGPVEVEEDNPWFEYQVSSTFESRRIELVYDLHVLADRVEPEDLEDYVRALGVLFASDSYSLKSPWDEPPAEPEVSEEASAAIGCGMILILALGAAVFVAGLFVVLTRTRRPANEELCNECRTPLPEEETSFCPRCGAPVSRAAPAESGQPPAP